MLKNLPACCGGCSPSSICVDIMEADTLTVSENVVASSVSNAESFPPCPLAGKVLCLWTCLFDSLDCHKRTVGMVLTDFFRGSFQQGCSLAGKRKRDLIACTKNYLYFLCIFLANSTEFIPFVITCTVLCNTVKCVLSYIPSIKFDYLYIAIK